MPSAAVSPVKLTSSARGPRDARVPPMGKRRRRSRLSARAGGRGVARHRSGDERRPPNRQEAEEGGLGISRRGILASSERSRRTVEPQKESQAKIIGLPDPGQPPGALDGVKSAGAERLPNAAVAQTPATTTVSKSSASAPWRRRDDAVGLCGGSAVQKTARRRRQRGHRRPGRGRKRNNRNVTGSTRNCQVIEAKSSRPQGARRGARGPEPRPSWRRCRTGWSRATRA